MAALTIQQTFELAVQHLQAGRLRDAEQIYRQILAQEPAHAGARYHLGLIARQLGRTEVAVDLIRQAIAVRPGFAEAHYNLGIALKDKGQLDEAIAAYRQAIALEPGFAEAHNNLGIALKDNGQLDEAIAAYQRAIAVRPGYAEAHNNLGVALNDRRQFDDAIAAFRQAIAFQPGSSEIHSNLGSPLKDSGQLDEAIAAYRLAIAIRPNLHAHSNLIFALHHHPAYDAHAIAEELQQWNRLHAEPLAKFIQSHSNDPDPDRRLCIGYVSPDFRNHVVGRNLLPLFQQHDRRQFDITCYSQVRRPDAMTSQFQQKSDRWRNIVGLSDEQVAKQIREDRIDLLIDLTLHSADNRLLVFARKPAPVQATYLGYCGTSGLRAMDFRLSDPFLDPPGTDLSLYSEKTIYPGECYWCYNPNSDAPDPGLPPALARGSITFGCLNSFTKVSQAAVDLWASILRAVPKSRLLLHAGQGSHRARITDRFAGAGVETDRVEFIGIQPGLAYLQTYNRIDVALDPFPYAGGITSCDTLWMGVPLVTLAGKQSPVSRGGCSILANVGLSELIARDTDAYVSIAVDLAGDLPRLSELRQTLRRKMEQSPLMDAPKFARNIEAAYRQMWRNWCLKK